FYDLNIAIFDEELDVERALDQKGLRDHVGISDNTLSRCFPDGQGRNTHSSISRVHSRVLHMLDNGSNEDILPIADAVELYFSSPAQEFRNHDREISGNFCGLFNVFC